MTDSEFKSARLTLGLTKIEMAEALGLGANGWRTILRIEQGSRVTGPMRLAVLKLLDDHAGKGSGKDWKHVTEDAA